MRGNNDFVQAEVIGFAIDLEKRWVRSQASKSEIFYVCSPDNSAVESGSRPMADIRVPIGQCVLPIIEVSTLAPQAEQALDAKALVRETRRNTPT